MIKTKRNLRLFKFILHHTVVIPRQPLNHSRWLVIFFQPFRAFLHGHLPSQLFRHAQGKVVDMEVVGELLKIAF